MFFRRSNPPSSGAPQSQPDPHAELAKIHPLIIEASLKLDEKPELPAGAKITKVPGYSEFEVQAVDLGRTVGVRVTSNFKSLTKEEQAVLLMTAHRYIALGWTSLSIRELQGNLPFDFGASTEMSDLVHAAEQLHKRGLVVFGTEPKTEAHTKTVRLTLKALEQLKLYPYAPLPLHRVAPSENVFRPLKADELRIILRTPEELSLFYFGKIVDGSSKTVGSCRALAAISANVDQVIATPDGGMCILGFPWANRDSDGTPFMLLGKEQISSGIAAANPIDTRIEASFSPDRRFATIPTAHGWSIERTNGSEFQTQGAISTKLLPFVHHLLITNDATVIGYSEGWTSVGSKIVTGKEKGLVILPSQKDARPISITEKELEKILPKSTSERNSGFAPRLDAVAGSLSKILALVSRGNGEAAPAALISIEGDKCRLLSIFNTGYVSNGTFSADGSLCAVPEYSQTERQQRIRVVKTDKTSPDSILLDLPPKASTSSVRFSPSGKRIACTFGVNGSRNGGCGVKVWEFENGKAREILSFVRDLHSYDGTCDFTGENKLVFMDHVIGEHNETRPDGVFIHELTIGSDAETDALPARQWALEDISNSTFPLRGVMTLQESIIARHTASAPITASTVCSDGVSVVYGTSSGEIVRLNSQGSGAREFFPQRLGRVKGAILSLAEDPHTGSVVGFTNENLLFVISEKEQPTESFSDRSASAQSVLVASQVSELEIPEIVFAEWGAAPNSIVTVNEKGMIVILDSERLGGPESSIGSLMCRASHYCIGVGMSPQRTHLMLSSNGGQVDVARIFRKDGQGYLADPTRICREERGFAARHITYAPDGRSALIDRHTRALRDGGQIDGVLCSMGIPGSEVVSTSFSPAGTEVALGWQSHGRGLGARIVSLNSKDPFGRPRVIASLELPGPGGQIHFGDGGRELIVGSHSGELLVFGDRSH